jgi:signal peptidase II
MKKHRKLSGGMLKKYLHDYLVLALSAGVLIGLDQFTKGIIRMNLAFNEIWSPWPWLTPYARIVHWYNTGAAFGIFQGFGSVFTVLAILVSGVIIYYFPHIPRSEKLLRVALTLQLAGALGNLIDRIFIGHVTDFISIGNFAVFNVADSCITVGVAVLLLAVLLQELKARKEKAAETAISEVPAEEQKSD